jgi:hypothetical protein
LNNLNQFEFDFELNLTAALNCSQGPPVSAPASPVSRDHAPPPARTASGRCQPPHAARPRPRSPTPSPAPPRRVAASHCLTPRFPLPSPSRCWRCHHRLTPFLSPPSSSLLERDQAPLAACPPRQPAPPHREIEATTAASTPHGELTPPAALILIADLPSPLR